MTGNDWQYSSCASVQLESYISILSVCYMFFLMVIDQHIKVMQNENTITKKDK